MNEGRGDTIATALVFFDSEGWCEFIRTSPRFVAKTGSLSEVSKDEASHHFENMLLLRSVSLLGL